MFNEEYEADNYEPKDLKENLDYLDYKIKKRQIIGLDKNPVDCSVATIPENVIYKKDKIRKK